MPDLDFKVTGIEPATKGLVPLLNFQLEVTNTPPEQSIHAVILQAQIQIQSTQRRYEATEKEKLKDLFGTPERWGSTLRARLWTLANTSLRPFTGKTTTLLTVPCTYDLNVATTKYFHALESGDVPLLFLFSGTVFYEADDGRLQVQQISWNKECAFRMPVQAWRDLMEQHYPQSGFVMLQRETLDRLYTYRRDHGLTSWDEAIDGLLPTLETTEIAP
jgi:Family of unknown function (DUF6084)